MCLSLTESLGGYDPPPPFPFAMRHCGALPGRKLVESVAEGYMEECGESREACVCEGGSEGCHDSTSAAAAMYAPPPPAPASSSSLGVFDGCGAEDTAYPPRLCVLV
mmetsp:Transcript_5809/g.8609  ORF Transcript_5809/g.8609 Transcript_5809/m.8609 type:complete len:107 (+) Transcript_5809:313-633(+)